MKFNYSNSIFLSKISWR